VCNKDPEGYAGGSVTTGRASDTGQGKVLSAKEGKTWPSSLVVLRNF
jgi:hypothetical protein